MGSVSLRKIRSHIMPIAVLVGITLVVYAASMGHKFLLNWDDSIYVVNNESIRGLSWVHLKEAFTQFYGGNYAPIQIISYIVDYTLWGLRPAGFIFSNVLIHIINGVLFYVLLVYLTRRKALGFLAAFIFLLHPVQVESVVWISQRKNLLAMLFFLVSFLFYIDYQ